MKFETYDYRISGHFASAIINGDYSGFTEIDAQDLDSFMATLPQGAGHWTGFDEDTKNFTRCEVCGLFAATYLAHYLVEVQP